MRRQSEPRVRRFLSVVLLGWFALISSGAVLYAHNAAHHDDQQKGLPAHDESTCPIHLALRAPATAPVWTPPLIGFEKPIARLTLAPTVPVCVRTIVRIDCRGPPSC